MSWFREKHLRYRNDYVNPWTRFVGRWMWFWHTLGVFIEREQNKTGKRAALQVRV